MVKSGEAVRCWSCSSDLNPYCNDPFVPSLADTSGLFSLEYCDGNTGASYPYLTTSKSACKKQKKYIGGNLVISRGCTWKRQDDYSTACAASSSGANEVTLYCETCDRDGCNGASAVGMAMALMMAPLGLLLFK
ncbi:jg5430 [Pararge aegeria aegeria]|uniref:Jg5430 protein n=1 Tax=Pararge aegeria aegeria TaxID=348720 RepID=A0A8S4SAU6_9NEOP|nr:jg5430 [Pararge aegeria aegeria]